MYTASTIQDAIFGSTPLIGWQQEQDPSKDQLDSDMVTSTSGRYFNLAHPSLTIANIFSIMPKVVDYVYTAWSNTSSYSIGDIRSKGGKNWKCIQAYVFGVDGAKDPESQSSYWQEWTSGNAKSKWLRDKTRAYVLAVLDDFLDQKQWGKTAKTILEERALFDGSQYEGEETPYEGKTVGFQIKQSQNMGLLTRIHTIGLQFSNNASLTINLYHSSQASPVQTEVIEYTGEGSMQWFELDWDLPYMSTYDAGGTWSIEYEQIEGSNAINKARDWGQAPHTGYIYTNFLWSDNLQFHPFKVATAQRNDPSKRLLEYTNNFGLNLIASVHCDYTNFFVRQKSQFQNAIYKGVAKYMLREIALNPNSRINLSESNGNLSKEDLLYEIDGNTQGRATGIGYEYKQALEAIKIDTEGIDNMCLPCGRKGVRIKSIG